VGSNVSAFWGDVNGDGRVGVVTLSAGHSTVTFSFGLIPLGGRFTDFIFDDR
jgi:hypothetical protein